MKEKYYKERDFSGYLWRKC